MPGPKSALSLLLVLTACASSPKPEADRASPQIPIYADATAAPCPFEKVADLNVSVTTKTGGRPAAEAALHRALRIEATNVKPTQ